MKPSIDLTQLVTAGMKAANAAAAAQQADNATQQAYLASTDWLVLRQLETGKAVPPELAALRQAARAKVTAKDKTK